MEYQQLYRDLRYSEEISNDEKQVSIKKHIQISGMLGINSNYDTKNNDFYETIVGKSVVENRYQKTFSKHPTMIEIKEKYKPIKPAKTKKRKTKY